MAAPPTPRSNPIAAYLGGEALDAEDATNITLGLQRDLTDALSVTLDYFNIEVKDRISSTGTIDIRKEDAIPECPMTHAVGGRLAECL